MPIAESLYCLLLIRRNQVLLPLAVRASVGVDVLGQRGLPARVAAKSCNEPFDGQGVGRWLHGWGEHAGGGEFAVADSVEELRAKVGVHQVVAAGGAGEVPGVDKDFLTEHG